MSGLFIAVLNMSFTASFVALAVLLLHLPLKKAPQVFSYALWAVVFFKLICPFAIEAPVSVNPINPQTIPQDIVYVLSARNSGLLSPLAFGERGLKARIRNVLNYKKTAFWISAAAAAVLIAAVIILAVSARGPVPAIVDPDGLAALYGNYIFDKQVYMNPLSSFIAFDGLKEYYTLSEKTLVITGAYGARQYIAVTMEEGAPWIGPNLEICLWMAGRVPIYRSTGIATNMSFVKAMGGPATAFI